MEQQISPDTTVHSTVETPPRIFVVGTGRSGTWLLYRLLQANRAVHTFPSEMRFLVDSDGLMDLVDALTTRYSVVKAREALYRFERLMKGYLTDAGSPPYRGFELSDWIGHDYYFQRLEQFCAALVDCSYDGRAWQVDTGQEGRLVLMARKLERMRKGKAASLGPDPRRTLKVVRYFSDRKALLSMAAAFVDDIFLHAARANGRQTWSEKTPQHLVHLDFLWELFPDSAVIHIKRDPRGVVHSLTKQPWAPGDLQDACLFLRGLYERWFDLRAQLDVETHRYLEIKLEAFAASPAETLEQITRLCRLPDEFGPLPDVRADKVDYWREVLTARELRIIHDCLGPCIERMGYE